MTRRSRRSFLVALVLLGGVTVPAAAQRRPADPPRVSADSLRARLFVIADDSMGGRDTGARGNALTADYVAAAFRAYGLEPAGENGGWFQTIPFYALSMDAASGLDAGGTALATTTDLVQVGSRVTWSPGGASAVYGGVVTDSATWPAAGGAAGRLVVFQPRPDRDLRGSFGALGAAMRAPRFAGASAFAIAMLDDVPQDLRDQLLQARPVTDTTAPPVVRSVLLVSVRAADAMLGRPIGTAVPGATGPALHGSVAFRVALLPYPARNVIGILRGRDPALSGTFVSLSAHNDHVGLTGAPVDHDSVRAFNRVMRPLGADSRGGTPTPEQAARIAALRDSLGRAHPARRDSVFNGADDDGSGTVALMEIARVLSQGPRPRRSILFVSHAAEERGLLGSQWFTDHPTVARDSIIAEIDEDMIGRGGADDLPGEGGPTYLEVIGAKRLSPEFGDTLEAVNARQGQPFVFNYAYDAPGHPLQYYCRADHYSYARYGIPSVALSRGEHLDYHQVTDEPQYIDYDALARVAQMVADAARTIANMDHRPLVTGPHGDPHAPCRQ